MCVSSHFHEFYLIKKNRIGGVMVSALHTNLSSQVKKKKHFQEN
jgi:hypothetical protein